MEEVFRKKKTAYHVSTTRRRTHSNLAWTGRVSKNLGAISVELRSVLWRYSEKEPDKPIRKVLGRS